ncbi:protein phosphatase 1 regulatory subunit 35 [Melanotaenia boesemani]|uniref:protein phosphatase 1 regulatory subunit 35 n=1 Tax=Melanotaenia boesemani TaxID=1250792 RepID=UPI001C04A5EC|nr:protein phosphatase 1 regulatory subunit 35 [Melanotaenia boesemani]XP_041857513.1 protein phosphatase 1 regulatory subunit 35 [Melanotaenia boesemani]
MSVSSLHSPPPSPQPAPLPLSSSSVTCCPELELSATLSPAPKPLPLRQNQQIDQSQLRPRPLRQTVKKSNTKVRFEEPVVTASLPEAQQPMGGQRGGREHHHAFTPSSKPPAATSSPEPSCLEEAELNTTLALKAELLSLQSEEFDSKKAIQETLRRSDRTKNLISARATEVVNVSRSQQLFTSLVSVSVQKDQLISQVLHGRLLLAPPPRSPPVTMTVEAPSLLVFRTSDQLRQKPLPQEEEPAACQPGPMARPASSTFDLCRRQRCWEATP